MGRDGGPWPWGEWGLASRGEVGRRWGVGNRRKEGPDGRRGGWVYKAACQRGGPWDVTPELLWHLHPLTPTCPGSSSQRLTPSPPPLAEEETEASRGKVAEPRPGPPWMQPMPGSKEGLLGRHIQRPEKL